MDETEGSQSKTTPKTEEGILGNLRPRSEAVTKIIKGRRTAMARGILVETPEEQRVRHLQEARASELKAEKPTEPKHQAESPQVSYSEKLTPTKPEIKGGYEFRDVFIYDKHSKTTGSMTRAGRITGRSPRGEALLEQLTIPVTNEDTEKKTAYEVELPAGLAYYEPFKGSSLDMSIAEANLKRSGLPHKNKPLFVSHIPGQREDVESKGYEIVSAKVRIEEYRQTLPKAA